MRRQAVAASSPDPQVEYRRRLHDRVREILSATPEHSDQPTVESVLCLIAEVLGEFQEDAEAASTKYRQVVSRTGCPSADAETMVQRGKLLGRAAEASDLAQRLATAIESLT